MTYILDQSLKRRLAQVPTLEIALYVDERLRLLNRGMMGDTRKNVEREIARLNTLRWQELDGGRAKLRSTVINGDRK